MNMHTVLDYDVYELRLSNVVKVLQLQLSEVSQEWIRESMHRHTVGVEKR
jgi:hypothetical protein